MPIYEYVCDNCGHDLEAFQKLSEARLTECPNCEQNTLRKKVSAAGFRLKGGGWYETDFKSGSKKNVAADGGSGDSKSESKDSSGGDSKSAGKSDSKSESASTGKDSAKKSGSSASGSD